MIASTQGDIGDIVILMSILSQVEGGPHTILLQPSSVTKAKPGAQAQVMLDVMKPLAESQPYIKEMRMIAPGDHVDWASAEFRKSDYQYGNTLFDAHLSNLMRSKGIGSAFNASKPWLSVPVADVGDRVIVARSGRHRNQFFPWSRIVAKYSHKIAFVGLKTEWAEFCSTYGYVDYLPTKNMLEVAQAIASSVLFIGNQSSPNAVAEGLKHNMIQEVSLYAPDCIYKRSNARHCYDGVVELPGLGMGGDEVTEKELCQQSKIHTEMTPPGLWQYPGCPKAMSFKQIVTSVKSLKDFHGKDDGFVKDAIISYTISRCPDWQNENKVDYSRVLAAMGRD